MIITKDKYLKIRSIDGKMPMVMLDGVIIDLNTTKIDPEIVESIGFYKEGTGTKYFGEKGKEDIIDIKTRKDGSTKIGERPGYFEVVKTPPDNVKPIPDYPYVLVEDMPEFIGGKEALLTWISQNIRYPEEASKQKIEGQVVLRFVVKSDGKVREVVVLKSDNPVFNEEAIRVVSSMNQWKPGSQNGKKVDVYYMTPVEFKLK